MSNPPLIYRLLNDIQSIATEMEQKDRGHLAWWHRISVDARAILRLITIEDDARVQRPAPSERSVNII